MCREIESACKDSERLCVCVCVGGCRDRVCREIESASKGGGRE